MATLTLKKAPEHLPKQLQETLKIARERAEKERQEAEKLARQQACVIRQAQEMQAGRERRERRRNAALAILKERVPLAFREVNTPPLAIGTYVQRT